MEHSYEIEAEYTSNTMERRLAKRLVMIGQTLHLNPSFPFTSLTENEAERAGYYRYLNHKTLLPFDTHAPHREQTLQRAKTHETFLALHDTTEMNFSLSPKQKPRTHLAKLSEKKQGFSCHTTFLVGMPEFSEPFGVSRFQPYVHQKYVQDEQMRDFWQKHGGLFENESQRWHDAVLETEKAFEKGQIIHVMDRESDTYAMLMELQQNEHRFVLRHRVDRKLEDGSWFEDAWDEVEVLAEKHFKIQRRLCSHGLPRNAPDNYERESREVHLHIKSQRLRIKRAQDPPKGIDRKEWKKAPSFLEINAIHAKEVAPPEGVKEVEWYLLTSEPIKEEADCLLVVEIYDTRWMIEELFKSLKTGCGYEKRQEESAGSLIQMLALSWPQAWWLLRLRFLHRHAPEKDSSELLEDWEEKLLRAATTKYKWKRKAKISDIFSALAYLGGHYERKKLPGWAILGRGYQKFLGMCEAVSLYRSISTV